MGGIILVLIDSVDFFAKTRILFTIRQMRYNFSVDDIWYSRAPADNIVDCSRGVTVRLIVNIRSVMRSVGFVANR